MSLKGFRVTRLQGHRPLSEAEAQSYRPLSDPDSFRDEAHGFNVSGFQVKELQIYRIIVCQRKDN